MKKRKINVATYVGIVTIDAEVFDIVGYSEKFAIHNELDENCTPAKAFSITELSTGMSVCNGFKTKRDAILCANNKMAENIYTWSHFKDKAKKQLRALKIKFPLNK